jgi:hypothetical protein
MSTNTLTFAPSSAEDADAIGEVLSRLNGAKLELRSGDSFSIVPVLQSWSITEREIRITFYPGVIELLGRELTARELIKAAGNSVCH